MNSKYNHTIESEKFKDQSCLINSTLSWFF